MLHSEMGDFYTKFKINLLRYFTRFNILDRHWIHRPIKIWNTHFSRLFLSVSNYILVFVVELYFKTAIAVENRFVLNFWQQCDHIKEMEFKHRQLFFFSKNCTFYHRNWPDHGYEIYIFSPLNWKSFKRFDFTVVPIRSR